jgi:hypothetical protein
LKTTKIGYDNIPAVNIRKSEIEELAMASLGVKNKPDIIRRTFFS